MHAIDFTTHRELAIDSISTNAYYIEYHHTEYQLTGIQEMKTIPFDLKKALDGYEMVTRAGDKIIDYKYWEAIKLLSVLVISENGRTNMNGYGVNGRFYKNCEESPSDLLLIPKLKKHYVSVMQRPDGSFFSCTVRDSIEECQQNECGFDSTMKLHTRLEFEAES